MADVAQGGTPFSWTEAREKAAVLLAEDRATDAEVGAAVGVRRETIWAWKKHPAFAARVKEVAETLGEVALRYAVGRRARRLEGYDQRREELLRVVRERAADPAMAGVPGGGTGLLVRTVKVVGSGENAERVEEFKVDVGLLRELRELERQAAVEAGDWQEAPPEGSLSVGGVVLVVVPAGGRGPDPAKVLGLAGPKAPGG